MREEKINIRISSSKSSRITPAPSRYTIRERENLHLAIFLRGQINLEISTNAHSILNKKDQKRQDLRVHGGISTIRPFSPFTSDQVLFQYSPF